MAPRRICLIHTTPAMVQVFTPLCRDLLPDVKVTQLINESMLKDTIEAGRVRQPTIDALITFADACFKMGIELAMITCCSVAPAVDLIQNRFQRPVLRIDEPLAEAAVAKGRKIGVAATLATALKPVSELLRRKAREAAKELEVVECLCEGAFEAGEAGDSVMHDALVTQSMIDKLSDVDVIVLPQASLVPVACRLPREALTAPVLSSPELAMEYVRERLARLRPN